jgi:hypothetical protein
MKIIVTKEDIEQGRKYCAIARAMKRAGFHFEKLFGTVIVVDGKDHPVPEELTIKINEFDDGKLTPFEFEFELTTSES